MSLKNRSFLKLLDYTPAEIEQLLDLAADLKAKKKAGIAHDRLHGKNIALIFEKTSTRTRCSFEVAAHDLGMQVTYLDPSGSQIGKKESIADTARVLGRMFDGIEYRGYGQQIVEDLAHYAGVPVWNGLTNEFHPTQILADFLTIREHFGKLKGIHFVYFGDARYNMGNSLMVGCAKMGLHFTACAPKKYQPDPELVAECEKIAAETGATISFEEDPAKAAKGDKKFLHEAEVFKALAEHLDAGKSARTFSCGDDDRALVETCDLLSLKPIIYAANMDEAGFADYENNRYFRLVRDLAQKEGAQVLPICAKLEQDIAELDDPEERAMFLEDLGIEKSGLDRLIQCSYDLLGLISFLTYGKDECRAWTIRKGTKAPQAAGKIHSDIERGFIRAEVIAYEDMIACGSVNAAKEKGLLRSEGKEYVVQDGDMVYFRFNV